MSDWREFDYRNRRFVEAKVPRGANEGQKYTVAKRVAERYEVKSFFKSGGCGLLLNGLDLQTGAEVLIKTTLRYDVAFEMKGRDRENVARKLKGPRQQLQIERRILVLLKNEGCNAVPNPNDYVFDWNPSLEGPHIDVGGSAWKYDDESMLSSEPYLVMEHITGRTVADLLKKECSHGVSEERALLIMQQVSNVLRVLHRPFTMRNAARWQIIYQDLKPENILVGPHDQAVVVDMGGCFLRINGNPRALGARTSGYGAPECDTDKDGLRWTAAVDSYAFGSTVYHMLTGVEPAEFMQSRLGDAGPKAVPPDRWNWDLLKGKCGQSTYDFVQRCLEGSPAARPRDGQALYDEIERLRR
ncbi:MAG TPA: protein kinase [Pirellulales bacterium]|nr:protein kinase [Pirellulales bacterium]